MFQKVLECSRRFQNVPEGSRMFQKVSECSRRFQNVPKDSRMFQKVLKCSRRFQNVPKDSRMFQKVLECSKRFRMFQKILKCSKRFQNVPFLECCYLRNSKLLIRIFLSQFTLIYLLLRKFTSNYRAGKKHFLQDFTLNYQIVPKFIKNYHILRKKFSNSHPCSLLLLYVVIISCSYECWLLITDVYLTNAKKSQVKPE